MTATADRTVSSRAPAPSSSKSAPKIDADVAVVTAQRTEIPVIGHPAIVIELPVVSGLVDPAAQKKIDALLTPEALLDEPLSDVRTEAALVKSASDPSVGVQGSTFTVDYNRHGVLEINSICMYEGAYPSANRHHVLIDLRSGAPIGREAFRSSMIAPLLAHLDVPVHAEEKRAKPDLADAGFGTELLELDFPPEGLDSFSVSDAGVTFHLDYGFPHVVLALQPKGDFFMSWTELAPYIEPTGPLARIAPAR